MDREGFKATAMIQSYSGHYLYNKVSITSNAPGTFGVYYCGFINGNNLTPLYIGRAAGDGVTIKSRLLDHLSNDRWPNVTHFGFRICTTKTEAIDQEALDIRAFQPPYNTQGK